MKARVTSRAISPAQTEALGANPRVKPEFALTVGREYVVYGISWLNSPAWYGHSPLYHVVDDDGNVLPTPACLFEITDGRVSKHWVAIVRGYGLALLPPEFHREYFFDDLSDREPGAVETFRKVRGLLDEESRSPPIRES